MVYGHHMHNEAHTDADLVTTADVARILGKDVSTVNRMVARGDLTPAIKAPGKRGAHLFTKSSVDALLEQRTA